MKIIIYEIYNEGRMIIKYKIDSVDRNIDIDNNKLK